LQPAKTQCPVCGGSAPKGSSHCPTCGVQLSKKKIGPKKRLIGWLLFLCEVVLLILLSRLIRFIVEWLAEGEGQQVIVLRQLCNLHP
jgi:predicted nucleic acid-binding Zn ribbon protein